MYKTIKIPFFLSIHIFLLPSFPTIAISLITIWFLKLTVIWFINMENIMLWLESLLYERTYQNQVQNTWIFLTMYITLLPFNHLTYWDFGFSNISGKKRFVT